MLLWKSYLYFSQSLFHKKVCASYYSTIFAVSSGQGKCGVAVVRVSGPQASLVMKQIAGLQLSTLPERKALLRRLRYPNSGEVIDRSIVLWFPKPRSFTGEDTCELHVHGSSAVVSAILNAIGQIPGCRPAMPGEFTRRAFLGGKLDLTEVEGLADLLQAETEAQRRQALLQLEGHLGQLYTRWRTQLIQCMAHLEAYIDFSEDDNIEDGVLDKVKQQALALKTEIQEHLQDGRRGEMLRSGVQVSIVGQPNVGKSSILNALGQRPAAIVTPHAGTTRDIVQLSLDLGGFPVQLADTAGLRESRDEVEQEGIHRARSLASRSDLVVLVTEAHCVLASGLSKLPEFLQDYLSKCQLDLHWQDCIVVLNKADLLEQPLQQLESLPENVVLVSCINEDGFPAFLNILQQKLAVL
ncbi:hypothetical protein B566_EDAN006623 [Ephemera danica]|nr:hypothetical protein B566_EDAN006623 [Ephemera danica]